MQGTEMGAGKTTVENQDAITVTKTQGGGGNGPPPLPSPPLPLDREKDRAARYAPGAVVINGSRGGGIIANTSTMGYLETFHIVQLPEATGTVATAILKADINAK